MYNILEHVIRDLVLYKTLSIVYNTFLKAQPEDGSTETSRNMQL
jgi:hypothetical protein